MKTTLTLFAVLIVLTAKAQQHAIKDSSGNYHATKTVQVAVSTGHTFTDGKGKVYPLFTSIHGKLYYVRTSKSGNEYKVYVK